MSENVVPREAGQRGTISSTDIRAWALAGATMLFLFIGFGKGLISVPVDATLISCAVLCLALFPFFGSAVLPSMSVAASLTGLVMWLAFRLLPDVPSWGSHKLVTLIVLGGPAFLAGVAIARDNTLCSTTTRLLAFAGLPATAVVVGMAATGNPYSFTSIGSGGYQLTGAFLALSMIAATALRQPALIAIAALGCAVTGHISSAVFGVTGVALVLINSRDWQTFLNASIATAGVVLIYTILVAPPLVFMRVLWKFGGALLVWTGQPVTPEEAQAQLGGTELGAGLNSLLDAMPEESQQYLVDVAAADRLGYFATAWRAFLDAPVLGHGYGALSYLDAPYPHNALLEIAAETGIIGAILVILAFGTAVAAIIRGRNGFVIGVCTVLFLTSMVSGYFGSRLLLFAFGLAAGARHDR